MIDNMEFDLADFEGMLYWVRCFDHVVNLVAKTFTCLFDVKEKSEGGTSDGEKDSKKAKENKRFRDLCAGLEKEEMLARMETYKNLGAESDDNEEGWVDELAGLSQEELKEFEATIRPVQAVIAKVRSYLTP